VQSNNPTPPSSHPDQHLREMRPITTVGTSDGAATKHGPLFDWFPDRFALLPWTIPASSLAPGLPPRDMAPRQLERFLLEDADYPQRDQIWAAVITRARQIDTAESYQILALGLAARGLRAFRNHLPILHRSELTDVDQDLIVGFQRRLATITLDATNLGGRLINSGISYAKVQWRRHLNRPPATQPDTDATIAAPAAGGMQTAFDTLITDMTDRGTPLGEEDVKLIAMTAIDGLTIVDAAQTLGLPLETVYKRRQRAEARIRQHIDTRDHEPDQKSAPDARGKPATRRGATASAEAAELTTRRMAPDPAPRRPTRRSTPPAQPASSDHDLPATPHGSDPTTPAPAHPNEPPH
jgi:hypothetical protein